MSRILRIFSIAAFVVLSGCAARGVIMLYPAAENFGTIRSVFVSTTREIRASGEITGDRSPVAAFLRYNISVPPNHETGEVDWPRGAPDPEQDFLTTGFERFSSETGFVGNLRTALRAQPTGDRTVVVFVHGFNNNFAEGLYRLAQLSFDMGLQNPTVHYSWPSSGNPLGYGYDRDSALFARDGLEHLLEMVRAAGADQILLVGHSMGAFLTVETLRQMSISDNRKMRRLINGVILISPDIDVDLFRQQATRIEPLPQPFVIFTSQKDRALRLSARLSGTQGRLGNVRDPAVLANLEVTLFDVTEFSDGLTGHFNAATSPELLKILRQLYNLDAAFRNDPAGRAGLIPGTILTVQKATQIVLSPVGAVTQ
jgi:esterase/lipase superfamily enzyme